MIYIFVSYKVEFPLQQHFKFEYNDFQARVLQRAVITVEPRFNELCITKSSVQQTIFFSPAKITSKCMEQNLDLTKSPL